MDWDYWDGSSLCMRRDAHAHVGAFFLADSGLHAVHRSRSLPSRPIRDRRVQRPW